MNPRDFLDVADEWASGNREAEWRSATSRAYYGAFHIARQVLEQWGFRVPASEQAHAYLWLRFANAGHPDMQLVGRRLQDLRGLRNQADYDLANPFDQRLAVDSVPLANDLIQLLEAAAALPALVTRITAAIRDYERDVLRQVTWQA